MSDFLSKFTDLYLRSKTFRYFIVSTFAIVILITINSLSKDNNWTKFVSVPAYFSVSDWKKTQKFRIQVEDNRSYAILLNFRISSDLQRKDVLKRFSDRFLVDGKGDNQTVDFEIEIRDNNGILLVKQIVKTQGISFHSKGDLGRLIYSIGLEKGYYILTLHLLNDEILNLDDTMVRITYLTK